MALLILILLIWGPIGGLSQAIPSFVTDVTQFGAVGDGITDDSQAFQKAWTEVCGVESGASTLILPAGKTFLLKHLDFQGPCKSSAINIQVLGDIAAPDAIDEDIKQWLSFSNVDGLNIQGNGQIDGRGNIWWQQADQLDSRPCALVINNCNNFQLRGLTHINSPGCHVRVDGSNGVTISDLHISAPQSSPNTDGIDIGKCTNVLIHDCIIGTGDDCVAIGGGSSFVNINNLACGPGHGISIGSLGANGGTSTVEEVHVKNCSFKGSTNGARIKTWQGGSGYARRISFEQITLDDVENPIIIDQYYCQHVMACENQTSAVKVSDVAYIGFHGTSSTDVAIKLSCSQSVSCDDIKLSDINIVSSSTHKPAQSFCFNAHGTSDRSVTPAVDCLKLVSSQQQQQGQGGMTYTGPQVGGPHLGGSSLVYPDVLHRFCFLFLIIFFMI